mgnify:FL=1
MSTLALFMMYALAIIAMLALFLINFYRDPERKIPIGNNIVSPADGKIISILTAKKDKTTIKKGFIGRIEAFAGDIAPECIIISIFMSPLDVHVNRSPINGKVISVKHTPGKYFAAFDLKNSLMNEKNEIIIKNGKIGKIKVIQIAGFLARRIICDAKKGGNLRKGQRIGKIVLGSQATLILPSKKVKIKAKEGQKVVAGETILAEY